MKLAQHVTMDLFGVKKRINSIKNIMQIIERQNKLTHTSLISTQNCVVYLYKWGHIIIYSYPGQSMVSIDIFSSLCSIKTGVLRKVMLDIFEPYKYEENEFTRTIGNV